MPQGQPSDLCLAFKKHCNSSKQLTNTLYLELLKDADILSLQPNMRPALDMSFAVGVSTQSAKLHRRLTLQGFKLAMANFKSRFDLTMAARIDQTLHTYVHPTEAKAAPLSTENLDKNCSETISQQQPSLCLSSTVPSEADCPSLSTSETNPSADDTLPAVFQRLLSPKSFTGTHRVRFDGEGHGKGADGRDVVAKGTGSVAMTYRGGPNASLASITNRCAADVRGVPLAARSTAREHLKH
eukprot:m.25955 g.25955  ORF g.25955 m.25955 type:complete len:241 (+) comp11649_c0_seq1:74-796(+)